MDVSELVTNAIAGDVDAFTTLVQRYQTMAFGYAFSILGDFHLAEDATQEAFIVAYRNLSNLQHRERFGGWLRGIIRFECLHLIRNWRGSGSDRGSGPHIPIDDVPGIPAQTPGPEEAAERQDSLDRTLTAVNQLPESERVVTVLYYIRDHPQRDVAEFLNLSVNTVNNRLRTARKHLREGGLLAMTEDALKQHDLPEDFVERVGEIIRAQGPIFDARFRENNRPSMLNAVTISDEATGLQLTAQVAQYLDDDVVRLISMDSSASGASGVGPGMRVIDTAQPVSLPLDTGSILSLIANVRGSGTTPGVVKTGIKVIDLFSPIPDGGTIGLAGDMQSGKLVLVEELIRRLEGSSHQFTVLVFVQAPTEAATMQKLDYRVSGSIQAIYLPVADASPEALSEVTQHLDAVITISSTLAAAGLYPAIDSLQSTSTALDPAIVGREHIDVVENTKRHLAQDAPGHAADHPDDTASSAPISRKQQLQWYLTQPFYVAEAFTNRSGISVPARVAVADVRQLLDEKVSALGKDDLYMTGSLADSVARSR